MVKEFNLSEKIVDTLRGEIVDKENIKEFIKRLKEGMVPARKRFIDKLAGDKLNG